MKKLALVGLLTLFLVPLAFAEETLATVNGKPITQSQLGIIKQNLGANFNEKLALDNLVRMKMLAQEAIRLGIDKQTDYALRKELAQQDILSNMLIQQKLKELKFTDEVLKKEYMQIQSDVGDKEYSIRHIVLKSEEEANDVIKELGKGGDFIKIAKQKSIDPRTKDNGGLINAWINKAMMADNARDLILKLQKGKYVASPIRSGNVWRVIYLEDIRNLTLPPFEKMKPNLYARLSNKEINKYVEGIRTKASITFPATKAQ